MTVQRLCVDDIKVLIFFIEYFDKRLFYMNKLPTLSRTSLVYSSRNKRKFSSTTSIRTPYTSTFVFHEKDSASLIRSIEEDLQEEIHASLSQSENFKAYQKAFARLASRFPKSEQAILKFKEGYDSLIDDLNDKIEKCHSRAIVVSKSSAQFEEKYFAEETEMSSQRDNIESLNRQITEQIDLLNTEIADLHHNIDLELSKVKDDEQRLGESNSTLNFVRQTFEKKESKMQKKKLLYEEVSSAQSEGQQKITEIIEKIGILLDSIGAFHRNSIAVDKSVQHYKTEVNKLKAEVKRKEEIILEKEQQANEYKEFIKKAQRQQAEYHKEQEILVASIGRLLENNGFSGQFIEKYKEDPVEMLRLYFTKKY